VLHTEGTEETSWLTEAVQSQIGEIKTRVVRVILQEGSSTTGKGPERTGTQIGLSNKAVYPLLRRVARTAGGATTGLFYFNLFFSITFLLRTIVKAQGRADRARERNAEKAKKGNKGKGK
jgi:hypothetical protein